MAMAVITTAATASTMSTDGVHGQPHRVTAFVAVLAGLLLCALALPRGIAAAVVTADGGAVITMLKNGGRLNRAERDAGLQRFIAARFFAPGDSRIALSMARLELMKGRKGDEQAFFYLKQAVSLSPNNAFLWGLLAKQAAGQKESLAEISNYLRLSYLTGPFEWSSVLVRLPVELANWNRIDAETRARARSDLIRMTRNREIMRPLVRLYLGLGYEERAILLREAFPASRQNQKKFFLKTVVRVVGAKIH